MSIIGQEYQRKERVKVVSLDGEDVLVLDLETDKHYMIDTDYFRRHYEPTADILPIHQEVWDKLDKQAEDLHKLKRANSHLKRIIRSLRQRIDDLRKESPGKQHLRKGQKRGKHGRHG